MKFFRLPRFGTEKKNKSRPLAGGRPKQIFLTFSLLLLAFIVSLYLFFPSNALKERLEYEVRAQTPVQMQISELDLAFPLTLKGRSVVIEGDLPGRQSLEIASVFLKPAWRTLAGSNPGAAFRADLMGGRIEGIARREGDLQAHLAGVRFSEPLMKGSAMTVSGTLREGSFTGSLPLKNETDTDLTLFLEQVQVSGLQAVGSAEDTLSLGTVRLKASGKGNALRIDEFAASGGALEASGGGTILVFEPMDRSRINLNLELRPTQSMDSNLREMLAMFLKPSRDGVSRLRVTGTLASPSMR